MENTEPGKENISSEDIERPYLEGYVKFLLNLCLLMTLAKVKLKTKEDIQGEKLTEMAAENFYSIGKVYCSKNEGARV